MECVAVSNALALVRAWEVGKHSRNVDMLIIVSVVM